MKTVLYQEWVESERGWGLRPDGFSLHLSEQDCQKYIKQYWDRMPNKVPDEYERPEGSPRLVSIPDEIYARLISDGLGKTHTGVRYGDRISIDRLYAWFLEQAKTEVKDAVEEIESERER